MDPLTIGLIAGAALGVGRSVLGAQQAERNRKAEGTIAQWSPWTGMGAQRVQDPDTMGNVMEGAAMGAAFGQGLKKAGVGKEAAVAAAGADATSSASGDGGAALTSQESSGENMSVDPKLAAAKSGPAYGAQAGSIDPALLAKYPWLRMS